MRLRLAIGFIGSVFLCAPGVVLAQVSTGAIAGVVRDTSGAVLPGVTVEAASPALIEKVRTAVTDGQGRYNIIELRPGTYTVTFTLPGFSTVRREGIELTAGFTATANAELKVGALEETVVVTGASPVVDVQNVRTQQVLSREVLDALPTGKTVSAFAALTLGVTGLSSPTIDVGGNKGETFLAFSVHGGRPGDGRSLLDGMDINFGGTLAHRNTVNQALVQEVALQTRGMSAETENGGVLINTIPKDGSNTVRLYVVGNGTHPKLQGDNITDRTRSFGITEVAGIKHVYEFAAGVGGPIKKDRLWFYAANMWQGSGEYTPGIYFNATQHTSWFYTPDLSQRKYTVYDIRDHSGRLTWQASRKQKVSFLTSWQYSSLPYKLSGGVDANRSPEASQKQHGRPIVNQISWQFPATSRLLLEAGVSYVRDLSIGEPAGGVKAGDIAKEELTTGFNWGARMENVGAGNDYGSAEYRRVPYRASVSYVTGSHAFKAGTNGRLMDNLVDGGPEPFGVPPYQLQVRNGIPAQVTLWATPYNERTKATEFALYAQDQWTLSRVTLNAGVRFDAFASSTPALNTESGMFRTAAEYPADNPGQIGKDLSPRLGVAYDVFGDGRTAVKASLGRYVLFSGAAGAPAGLAPADNYANLVASNTTRVWNDANGNLMPDCDLTNPLQNGECGQIANLLFGQPRAATAYDLEEMRGWHKRGYNWQFNANVQHQIGENIAASFGYYRTWYGNFVVTDNLAVTPDDHDPYCITAPTDPRLPNSGQQICGLYDIRPSAFGRVNNLVTKASKFGDQEERYDGFEMSLNTRLGGGRMLAGGVSFGRTITDECFVVDSPQQARPDFCRNAPPFSSTAQVKLQGVYPLPWWGLQTSGTLQNINTFAILANYIAPNSAIAPSLGHNLGSCRGAATCNGTVTIPLVAPNTLFGPRHTQLDLRLTKVFRFGRSRVQASFDAYNLFNSGSAVNVNNTYGAAWQRPLTIAGPRLFKFGGQFDW